MTEAFVDPSNALAAFGSRSRICLQLDIVDRLERLLVGSVFPGADELEKLGKLDPTEELACFENLATDDDDGGGGGAVDSSHQSLASFLLAWGKTLEKAEGADKLPTPLSCGVYSAPPPKASLTTTNATNTTYTINTIKDSPDATKISCNSDDERIQKVLQTSGVKLSFRKTKRYLSRNEQRGLEKGVVPDRKGAKIDLWSPGGILLLVQTVSVELPCDDGDGSVDSEAVASGIGVAGTKNSVHGRRLRLVAQRCDIDGDTVVKVSSERTVVRRLKEAVGIWIRMRSRRS